MNTKKTMCCPVCFKIKNGAGQWIDCDIDPTEQNPSLTIMASCPDCTKAKSLRKRMTLQLHHKLWKKLRDLQTDGKITSIHSTVIQLLWGFVNGKGKKHT